MAEPTGFQSIDGILTRMGQSAVAAHERLIVQSVLQAARFREDLRQAGLDPDGDLARQVMPRGVVLEQQVVKVNLELATRKERTVALTLQLFGKVVTTFAEARFSSEKQRHDSLEAVVVAIPVPEPVIK